MDNRIVFGICHLICKALKHDDDGVRNYARRIAAVYKERGNTLAEESILAQIGDIKVGMAVMDKNG